MKRPRTEFLALSTIVSILLLAGILTPVYAHANLIRSDPPANAILSASPHQVTLYFSEQLEPKLSGATIYDSNGKEVDTGYSVSPTDASVLIVSLPTLPSGVYTVSWHAISAVDGHHTSGSFSFGVGNVTVPVQNVTSQVYTFPSAFEVAERWLNLLGDVVFLGGSLFIITIWNPAALSMGGSGLDHYRRKVSARISKVLLLSAVVALAATMLLLLVQAIAAAQASPSLGDILAAAHTILTSTRLGEYWIFRVAVVFASIVSSAIILNVRKASRGGWLVILIVGLALCLSTSITSHNAAATEYNPIINLLSDWVHLVAVSAWVGGLAYLAIAITSLRRQMKQNRKIVVELLRRFSSVAVICVGAIGVTGLYNLIVEVGNLSLLFNTVYGRLVLLKIAIFAPMIAFGAINQFVFFDRVVDAKERRSRTGQAETFRWIRRFGFSIRSEMTLGVIVLLVVGLLTASAPVSQVQSSAPPYRPAPSVFQAYSTEGVNVTLKIFPYQVGANHFEIVFTDQQGTPINSVQSVMLTFEYLDRNVGVSIANATASANEGQYTLDGTYLSLPGNWRTDIWAQRAGGLDIVVAFQLDVPAISLRFSELPLSNDANPYGIAVDKSGVVWFAETGSGNLARYDPTTGTLNEFPLPQSGSRPLYVAIDNHGLVWLSETQYNQIVSFDPSSTHFTAYQIPTSGAVPGGLAADQDGNIWFTEEIAGNIGRLSPSTGNVTEYAIPTTDSIPIQTAVDSQGYVWFTESKGGKIGRINPTTGAISEFQPSNSTLLGPTGLTIAPDGTVWFTEHAGNRITEFSPQHQTFQSFAIPTPQAFPFGIAYHNEKIWFVQHIANSIGVLDPSTGTFSKFTVPNNSSDVQLLTVDQAGNVWFTLPASNVLGVLTQTTSTLQLESSSNNSSFTQLLTIASIAVAASATIAFLLGRRRMKRRERLR